MPTTIHDLRRFAVSRNFFPQTTLERALQRMKFVQADPIRAPARAQDLILRHRVKNYHAGDLERLYETLGIEEDFFVNYGYVTKSLHELMHPRSNSRVPADDISRQWPSAQRKKAQLLLKFVTERGTVHPREVDEHFAHGKTTNYWGGSSNATTHLLDAMHYQGILRVARREKGIRLYSVREPYDDPKQSARNSSRPSRNSIETRINALVEAVVRVYGPLPGPSLNFYVRRLRFAVPQWRNLLKAALDRSRQSLSHAQVKGVDWYWSTSDDSLIQRSAAGETQNTTPKQVRLLAPFDPLVHDRGRFELLWGWTYRFEAYTPVAKRKLGYYAMPLLWRDHVIGWANLSVKNSELVADFGYIKSEPPERAFKRQLEAEMDRIRAFLRYASNDR